MTIRSTKPAPKKSPARKPTRPQATPHRPARRSRAERPAEAPPSTGPAPYSLQRSEAARLEALRRLARVWALSVSRPGPSEHLGLVEAVPLRGVGEVTLYGGPAVRCSWEEWDDAKSDAVRAGFTNSPTPSAPHELEEAAARRFAANPAGETLGAQCVASLIGPMVHIGSGFAMAIERSTGLLHAVEDVGGGLVRVRSVGRWIAGAGFLPDQTADLAGNVAPAYADEAAELLAAKAVA